MTPDRDTHSSSSFARKEQRTPVWPLIVSTIGVCGILGGAMSLETEPLERLVLMNRYLARLSFILFIAIYAASPLAAWFPGATTRRLVQIRRSIGLGYALVMAAHLCAIYALQSTAGSQPLDVATAIGGGLGFAFVAALAMTSNDTAIQRLGPRNWKRLHTSALHWLWVIYFITYLGRVAERGIEYLPGLATVLLLLALRVFVRFGVRPSYSTRSAV